MYKIMTYIIVRYVRESQTSWVISHSKLHIDIRIMYIMLNDLVIRIWRIFRFRAPTRVKCLFYYVFPYSRNFSNVPLIDTNRTINTQINYLSLLKPFSLFGIILTKHEKNFSLTPVKIYKTRWLAFCCSCFGYSD